MAFDRIAYQKKYRDDHKDHYKEYNKRYAKDHPRNRPYDKEYRNKYYQINKERILNLSRDVNKKIKLDILTYYGGGVAACVLCGYDNMDALSIDHINGDGARHRREHHITSSYKLYRLLRRNGFPIGYRTLCMNCQWLERVRLGIQR